MATALLSPPAAESAAACQAAPLSGAHRATVGTDRHNHTRASFVEG